MANQIDMVANENILRRHGQGISNRSIARLLQLDRGTVARCIRLRADPKPAGVPAGIGSGGEPKPAGVPAGISASLCAPYHDQIVRGVEAGLTAQRIFQDLRGNHGFGGAYDTVKRYVRCLTAGGGHCVARMECAPGEEAQVDFGLGAPILGADGRRRRSWVFRFVLSHSRKGYSEAVFRQDAESFIRCIENAFLSFGGVARRLVLDNLRAAVKRADWHDPELSPKFAAFCRHCGTVAVPTRPRHPEHKGKVGGWQGERIKIFPFDFSGTPDGHERACCATVSGFWSDAASAWASVDVCGAFSGKAAAGTWSPSSWWCKSRQRRMVQAGLIPRTESR